MSSALARRGLMFVLSSPSGAGKTTISKRLLADPELQMSVSATTRPPRQQEREGVDYIFVDDATFDRMIANGEFLEHAHVFGNRYGTPRAPVDRALGAGRDVLFDIDWQGTQQLKHAARDSLVSVFLLPPSMAELERRLRQRAQDPEDVVQRRMHGAHDEISHWAEYDYVLVNDDLERTYRDVLAILRAERMRRPRCIGLPGHIAALRGG